MDVKKLASFSASWLIFGLAALSGAAVAEEPATAQPGASKPAVHDMSAHGNEPTEGMKCDHQGSMMKSPGGPHAGRMMCGQKGEMCDHKAGMAGEQGAEMMCNHEAGMAGDHKAGMACDHKADMMGGPMAGMMGGYGAGMSRLPLIMSLDLTDDQRSRINKLADALQRSNRAAKGSIMQESAKLRDLYAADKRNPSAIGKVYQKIFDRERKMIEATITTQNRIEEVLTPEQRTQLKNKRQEARNAEARHAHNHPAH